MSATAEKSGQVGPRAMQHAAGMGIYLPEWVRRELASLPADFTGQIELNCYKGGITDMKLHRRILKVP